MHNQQEKEHKPPIVLQEGETFGTIQLTTEITPITNKKQRILFTVDTSGSMSDKCEDGRSKLNHIVYSLENMVRFFAKNHTQTYISILSFDEETTEIINQEHITPEKVEYIIQKINQMHPEGCTNLEKALKKAGEWIEEQATQYMEEIKQDNAELTHIFMTDGESTTGKKEPEYLSSLVKTIKNTTNIFIGFGKTHDSYTLNRLATTKKSNYYFIDILEKAGYIYGEILHSILFKATEDAFLEIYHGHIYNWKTNTWDTKIQIDPLTSGSHKVFHIKTTEPRKVTAFLQDESNHYYEEIDTIPELENTPSNLTNDMYRQKTMEWLYQIRNIDQDQDQDQDLEQVIDQRKQTKQIKKEMTQFLTQMKEYMKQTNQMDDPFMKVLCDDIYISIATAGTRQGNMFCTSRQRSQGMQRSYNVTQYDIEEEDNTLTYHTCSSNIESPYTTLKCADIMSQIRGYTKEENDDVEPIPSFLLNMPLRPRKQSVEHNEEYVL